MTNLAAVKPETSDEITTLFGGTDVDCSAAVCAADYSLTCVNCSSVATGYLAQQK